MVGVASSATLAEPRPTTLAGLTGLRFFAAWHVVLFHVFGPYLVVAAPLSHFIAGGHAGVSLFFILSGFVLAFVYHGQARRGGWDVRQFFWARFARIYPLYLLGLAMMLPWWLALGLREMDPLSFAARTVAVLSLVQAWSPATAIDWNSPAWSLSAEAFFYVCLPALLPALLRLRASWRWYAVAGCWALSALPILAAKAFGAHGPAVEVFLDDTPLLRIPEFAIGIVLALHFIDKGVARPGATLAAGALSATLLLVLGLPVDLPWMNHVLLTPSFALMILGAAGLGASGGPVLGHPVIQLLGESSYSLYLLHLPVFFWLRLAALKMGMAVGTASFLLAYTVVVILASILAYKLVEVPARQAIRRWANSGSAPPLARDSPTRN